MEGSLNLKVKQQKSLTKGILVTRMDLRQSLSLSMTLWWRLFQQLIYSYLSSFSQTPLCTNNIFFLFFSLLQYSYGAGFCKKIHIIYSYLSLYSHKPIQHCTFLSFFIFYFPLLSYALLEILNWLPLNTYYILKL